MPSDLESCAEFLAAKFPSSVLGPEEAHFFSPDVYIRFARQYDGKQEAAAKAFQACLDWRKEYKPHLIDPEKDCATVLNTKFIMAGGVDKQGGGILVITLAHPSFKGCTKDERVKLYVWALEELARRGKEYYLFVSDFSLVGKEKDSQGMATRDTVAEILDKYYPDRMRLSFMYNPPWFISSFSPLSTAFLSSKLKAKVRTNCKTKDLLKEIDADQLPKELGGTYETEENVVKGLARFSA